MAWTITLDFDDGNGARDITDYVDEESFRRSRTLWNELNPTIDFLKFDMHWNSTIVNLFLGLDGAEVAVVVQDDAVDYFTGYVRTNWDFSLTTRPQSFKIECVDPGILLREKVVKPGTPALWENYTVYNSGDEDTSILSKLMVGAGFAHADIDADSVGDTIDFFPYVEDGRNYFDTMATLLFEHHRTFYFDASGNMKLFDWSPATISTGDTFDNDNMLGELRLKKLPEKYQQIAVSYWEHKTLSDEIVFSDTTDGNQTYKCSITLAADAYYPEGANDRDTYADYRVDGQDLIAVKDATTDTIKGDSVSEDTFTSYFTKALMKYHNNAGTAEYIYKLDVVGDAIVKGDLVIKRRDNVTGTDKKLKYEARHLYTALPAARLVRGLASYYRYADFTYTLTSGDSIPLGEYVSIAETSWLDINNTCVVTGREDNEYTGKAYYRLEGMAEYNAGDTVSDLGGVYASPFPTQSRDYITVGAANYAGDADYYCDGTSDETEINTALTFASGANIGTVHLVGGTFTIDGAINFLSDITIDMNGCTISRNAAGDTYAIDFTPGAGTNTRMQLRNGTVTSAGADSSTEHLVYGESIRGLTFTNVSFTDGPDDAIRLAGDTDAVCEDVLVESCSFSGFDAGGPLSILGSDDAKGIRLINSYVTDCLYGPVLTSGASEILNCNISDTNMEGITIAGGADNCLIGNNKIVNCAGFQPAAAAPESGLSIGSGCVNAHIIGNFVIDSSSLVTYGCCEHGAPFRTGDAASTSNASWAVSDVEAYRDYYSFKMEITATGSTGYCALVDNFTTTDMHDFLQTRTYRMTAWVYVPSSGGPQASEVTIVGGEYDGSWNDQTDAATGQDAWEQLTIDVTTDGSTTGMRWYFRIDGAASNGEYIYIDDVRIYQPGANNGHGMNFNDDGTDTITYGNSWQ